MALHIQSGSLTANAAATITFTNWYASVEVVNRSTSDMWVTMNGIAPTIAGNDCYYVAPSSWLNGIPNPSEPPEPALATTPGTTAMIISAGTGPYTVGGY